VRKKLPREKAELEKIQRQNRKDRATALLLYNTHYKEEFEEKGRVGRNTKRQKVK
jgi:hypothetical protein